MEIDAHIEDFKSKRSDWHDYFIKIAREVAKRSTCFAGTKLGAVAVKERQIVSTGYNGAPRKTMDCYERGFCVRRHLKIPSGHRYELCRSVHAEANTIINASRSGVSLVGAELYMYGIKSYGGEYKLIDAIPCFICKKMIINAGISKVHAQMANGAIKTFSVDEWAADWYKKDMLDDMDIYDSNYYEGKDDKEMHNAAKLNKADKNKDNNKDNNEENNKDKKYDGSGCC